MANRDLDFTPKINTVVAAPDTSLNLATGLAEVGATIADASEKSKILQLGAQAHVAFKTLDMQFRQQYADNPTDPEGLKNLQEARQNVVEGLGGNISSFYMGEWTKKTTELGTLSDVSNEVWAAHQQRVNTVNNVNNTIKTYTDMANKDGQSFGASDSTDGSQAMNYLQARSTLEQTGNSILGSDKTGHLLKDFNKDYVKSFVSGVAETSPEKATALINSPDIQQHFTTAERGDMIDQIARVKRQQQLSQTLSVTMNNGQLTDIVNDPNTTYYQKRATIDSLDMQGAITPSAAGKARRVIKSSSDLDTQTDTPVMAAIINQIYDLNAASNTNASDYLHGVQNLQQTILDKQGDGQLTAADAGKLNKELTTLTSKRIADATQSVGNTFYDANQQFDSLPPEYRGQATRQLFYASDTAKAQSGTEFTPAQYKAKANEIIAGINDKRRKAALATVEATTSSDAQLLKSYGYTAADVAETAKTHGITEQQVLQQLRAHRAGAHSKPVARTIGTSSEDVPPEPVVLKHGDVPVDGEEDNTGVAEDLAQ